MLKHIYYEDIPTISIRRIFYFVIMVAYGEIIRGAMSIREHYDDKG